MAEETPLRRQLRQVVVAGGGVLREAAVGLREGLQELQAPVPGSGAVSALELELEEARAQGRWLSDEERAERAAEREAGLRRQEAARRQRRTLLGLLAVSVLLPPLWPLALGLTAYLLFPRTTRRITLAALTLSAIGVVLLIAAVIAAVIAALVLLL